jgi:hypothetical protein
LVSTTLIVCALDFQQSGLWLDNFFVPLPWLLKAVDDVATTQKHQPQGHTHLNVDTLEVAMDFNSRLI